MMRKRVLRAICGVLVALLITIAAGSAETVIRWFLHEQSGKITNIGNVIYCTSNFP